MNNLRWKDYYSSLNDFHVLYDPKTGRVHATAEERTFPDCIDAIYITDDDSVFVTLTAAKQYCEGKMKFEHFKQDHDW